MAMLYLRNKPIGAISSGASGGGHTIENPSGTSMEQRSNLQFTDADVADDSTNNRTEISIVRKLTQAEFDELTPEEQNRGVIVINDANPIYVPSDNAVSVTADGVKTYSQLLDELYAKMDATKLTDNSYLEFAIPTNKFIYPLVQKEQSTTYNFIGCVANNVNGLYFHSIALRQSGSERWYIVTTTSTERTNQSSNVVVSGAIFTLYYNSITKVIESCDAEDVTYNSGTVEDALDDLNTAVDLCECLVVSATSVNSLPVTINNANITSDMVVINSVVNNVSVQLSDWSWETANGSITLSGTIKGTTNITLYLVKSR